MARWLILLTLMAALALPGEVFSQAAPDSGRSAPQGRHQGGPRFLDLNGDGINDLAPDRNGDGIPDDLDPMFQGRSRGRWGWMSSMPDSAMSDSMAFRGWWESNGQRPDWHRAWDRWQMIVHDAGGIDRMREMWREGGMTPRDMRRESMRGRHRPGGGMGGGGGSGGGGGGPGGGGGGRGGGGGNGGGGMGGGGGGRG